MISPLPSPVTWHLTIQRSLSLMVALSYACLNTWLRGQAAPLKVKRYTSDLEKSSAGKPAINSSNRSDSLSNARLALKSQNTTDVHLVMAELNTGPKAPIGKVSLYSSISPAMITSSRVGKCRNKYLASRLTRSGRELSRLSSIRNSRVCTTARERSSGIVIIHLH
jgi:hypothetical protein